MSFTSGAICACEAPGEAARLAASVEAEETSPSERDAGVGVGVGVGLGDGVGVGVGVGVALGLGVGVGEGVGVGDGNIAGPKYNPLTTALSPPILVTLILTCPLIFQTRYFPLLKDDRVRVSSSVLVAASMTSNF